MIATNYLYGLAKPDGLTIGMFQTFMYLQQLVGVPEVKYDVRKFNWLGSQERGQMMLYIRADSPYKSIEDIMKAKDPPKCGGSGATDQTALLTRLLEETIGVKFIRVLGYREAVRSISPWSGAKSCVELHESRYISAESLLSRGTKRL